MFFFKSSSHQITCSYWEKQKHNFQLINQSSTLKQNPIIAKMRLQLKPDHITDHTKTQSHQLLHRQSKHCQSIHISINSTTCLINPKPDINTTCNFEETRINQTPTWIEYTYRILSTLQPRDSTPEPLLSTKLRSLHSLRSTVHVATSNTTPETLNPTRKVSQQISPHWISQKTRPQLAQAKTAQAKAKTLEQWALAFKTWDGAGAGKVVGDHEPQDCFHNIYGCEYTTGLCIKNILNLIFTVGW